MVMDYYYDAWGVPQGMLDFCDVGALNPLLYRGYVYDQETGLYYLNSRYYDPSFKRFISPDAFVSTGQGLLGNNMFAYCNNNPVNYSDSSGQLPVKNTVYINDGAPSGVKELLYIRNQADSSVGTKKFGVASVAHGGCGAVATYNALVELEDYTSFDSVLDSYNSDPLSLSALGLAGMSPNVVADYFQNAGYTVHMTDDPDGIDIYSQTADACIIFYMYPRTYDAFNLFSVDAFGAHYEAYSKRGNEYVGYNTGGKYGIRNFMYPSDYAYDNGNFYAIGIYIYKPR